MTMKEKINRLKLAKMLMKFGEVVLADGSSVVFEGDFVEGVELYAEVEGELKPVADGEYETEDGRKFVVEEGKLKEFVAVEEVADEVKEEVEAAEEEEIPAEPNADEVKEAEDIDALKTRIAELEEEVKIKAEEIEKLREENEKLKADAEKSVAEPLENKFSKIEQFRGLNYFKN